MYGGYIYFMTNRTNKVLYVGMTSDLKRRIAEHIEGSGSAFTRKYHCCKLVYYECFADIDQAIIREKQLKYFKREWKNALVDEVNPEWKDLYEGMVMNPMIV